MTEMSYGINQESRAEYKERLTNASRALARVLGEVDVVTPRIFEDVQLEFGVDQEDVAAELGEMRRRGVLRLSGLGYALDEQALEDYDPAQGW